MSRLSLNQRPLRSRTWISLLLWTIISLIFLTSLINYIVNPYGTFNQNGHCQFNCKKKHLISDRMTKFYMFDHSDAKTIIMGTSRSGLFAPEILDAYAPQPVFNFSLAGSSIEEQAAYIEYAITVGKVEHVLWALDFFSFNPAKSPHPDFKPARLSSDIYWSDYGISLFNFGTLKNSFLTLKDNYPYHVYTQKTFRTAVHSELSKQLFSDQQLDFNINHTLNEYARDKSFLHSSLMKEPASLQSTLSYVKKIIHLCQQKGVSLHLYTSPVYTEHLTMYQQLGLYKSFVFWKKSLSDMTDYTDLAICNSITENKQNFRDSSHIRSDYGYLVTRAVYETAEPEDFAVKITSGNIDQHLEDQYRICFK